MKKYLFLFCAAALGFQACDSFEETNTDPSRPTEVPLELILPSLQAHVAFNQSAQSARVAGIVMDYYFGAEAQQGEYETYFIQTNAFNNYWRTGLYAGSLKDAQVIKEQAAEVGAPYYEGIAEILQALEYLEAASQFGDIPYTEALQGADNFQPAYTPMTEVYAGAIAQLDRGIALLSGDGGTIVPGADDLIFGGNAELWIKTANSLKARYLMHQVNRDEQKFANDALDALENGIMSIAEQPDFAYGTTLTSNNPLAKFSLDRPNTILAQAVGENGDFIERLRDRDDPRTSAYVTAELDDDGNETGTFFAFDNADPTLVWSQNDAVIPIISYAEVKFLEAEALERTGEDGTEAAKEAINASLALVGVDGGDFAEEQIGDDTDIEEIITEAYYSYYGIAHLQAWTNYRRTGFPDITPNPQAADDFNPSQVIPERWLYPTSEINLNSENVQAAIDRQGGQLLDNELVIFAD